MSDPDIRITDDIDVVVRRSPRYRVFLLLGIILGIFVAGVLVLLPVDTSVLTSDYSTSAAMGLLMMVLAILGAGLGGAVALILDRMNARKARTYTVRGEYVARKQAPPANRTAQVAEFGENGNSAPASAEDDAAPSATGPVQGPGAGNETDDDANGDVKQ